MKYQGEVDRLNTQLPNLDIHEHFARQMMHAFVNFCNRFKTTTCWITAKKYYPRGNVRNGAINGIPFVSSLVVFQQRASFEPPDTPHYLGIVV